MAATTISSSSVNTTLVGSAGPSRLDRDTMLVMECLLNHVDCKAASASILWVGSATSKSTMNCLASVDTVDHRRALK
eukprot:scaffold34594_cov165-Amphora_coffeaeformis.AAC.1